MQDQSNAINLNGLFFETNNPKINQFHK